MLITRKLSSRWNLVDNATGLKKFNWRGKHLWAGNNQSRSHSPELLIYGSGSSPDQGILRSTLTKTIACEQTGSMNKIHNLAAAAKFGLDNHSSLIFIQGCQIRFRSSSTFDFHPRLPNFNSCIIQIWFSSTSAKFEIISHPRSKSVTNGNRINHAWKVNHGYQYLDKSRHDTRKLNERLLFFDFVYFSANHHVRFFSINHHIYDVDYHLLIPVFKNNYISQLRLYNIEVNAYNET